MSGPGDVTAAAGGRGHLRASHADREQVIGILKTAFVRGMLAKDELDLRVGQTFAARTYGELAAVTADLPAGLAAAQRPQPARRPGEGRAVAARHRDHGGNRNRALCSRVAGGAGFAHERAGS